MSVQHSSTTTEKDYKRYRRWHYRTGLASALFIIFITLTGFILNHSDHWQLAHRPLPLWLTQFVYNIPQPIDSINWQRFLLDLHAGRFFGSLQYIFLDAISLCLAYLCFSGIYSYFKNKANS